MVERAKITVKGIVQGVGFRPYVYTLAGSLNLRGYVTNTSDGVSIDVEGENLSDFIARLPSEAPDLSKIFEVSVDPLPARGYTGFRIIESRDEGRFTLISPDVSLCEDCLKELFDPENRRYLYAFINCTNCGPRYTITRSVPYDRPNTTMSVFGMCPQCREEYDAPGDRRFHAQPNACAKCGPQVTLEVRSATFKAYEKAEPITGAITLLKEGAVVAMKGLGGFHIACDAMNDGAVRRLRERKRRSNKPFALMAPSLDAVEKFCEVSDDERSVLLSPMRPIVLLKKKQSFRYLLAEAVSPHNQYLGVMLPYTPLHYLLFYHPLRATAGDGMRSAETTLRSPGSFSSPFPKEGDQGNIMPLGVPHFDALVMTSGNLSEEPIVKDNEEVFLKLSGLIDAALLHNREIFTGTDDSVVRLVKDQKVPGAGSGERPDSLELPSRKVSSGRRTTFPATSFIRRSRGYTPEPVPLHDEGPEVLGCGADLKNTFTVTKGSFAIPSQHIGDMENYETLRFFEGCLDTIRSVYRVRPEAIAHDLHPDYLSTRWALKQRAAGGEKGVRTFGIQHHYAHVGSVMAEHGLKEKVIGVALDGTGYGTDGNLWGGEFLVADSRGFERVGHFRYIPLPGGEMAVKEPWRTAVSYLFDAAGDESSRCLKAIGFSGRHGMDRIEAVLKLFHSRQFAPLSSGAGRLFDAASALLGICDRNTFEGEAAMALESFVVDGLEEGYAAELSEGGEGREVLTVDFSRVMIGMVEDMIHGVDRRVVATKFHNAVSAAVVLMVRKISGIRSLKGVALSGGTFQNLYLLRRSMRLLSREGLNVFINRAVPCNDGGISLGQAYLCREQLKAHTGVGS
ncbi:MAG: carbamoyltransferase HypF [Nitrospirae bacterium]|nr:carbamoyltransferase HypF [Nitrospirota bacterium]